MSPDWFRPGAEKKKGPGTDPGCDLLHPRKKEKGQRGPRKSWRRGAETLTIPSPLARKKKNHPYLATCTDEGKKKPTLWSQCEEIARRSRSVSTGCAAKIEAGPAPRRPGKRTLSLSSPQVKRRLHGWLLYYTRTGREGRMALYHGLTTLPLLSLSLRKRKGRGGPTRVPVDRPEERGRRNRTLGSRPLRSSNGERTARFSGAKGTGQVRSRGWNCPLPVPSPDRVGGSTPQRSRSKPLQTLGGAASALLPKIVLSCNQGKASNQWICLILPAENEKVHGLLFGHGWGKKTRFSLIPP